MVTFWNGSPAIPLQSNTALNPEVITLSHLYQVIFLSPFIKFQNLFVRNGLAYYVVNFKIKFKVFCHKMFSRAISALLFLSPHFWNGRPAIPLQNNIALNPDVISLNQLK
jgi:hypothetical protein